MKISEVLKAKGTGIESISPDNNIREAMDKIAARRIGSLLVMKDGVAVGIISERDIFRLMATHGESA